MCINHSKECSTFPASDLFSFSAVVLVSFHLYRSLLTCSTYHRYYLHARRRDAVLQKCRRAE